MRDDISFRNYEPHQNVLGFKVQGWDEFRLEIWTALIPIHWWLYEKIIIRIFPPSSCLLSRIYASFGFALSYFARTKLCSGFFAAIFELLSSPISSCLWWECWPDWRPESWPSCSTCPRFWQWRPTPRFCGATRVATSKKNQFRTKFLKSPRCRVVLRST